MRKFTITLEVEVSDLSAEELAEGAEQGGCEVDELAKSDEVEAYEIADAIATLILEDEVQQEWIWAGSNLYARITGCAVKGAA